MQVPYLMHIPELDELWLIDGEQRFLITPKIYDLLVSNGADLPPAYGIDALREQNAKLRELVRRLISHVEHPPCEGCGFEMNCDGEHVTQCDEWLFMVADARELGV